jgi:chitinase
MMAKAVGLKAQNSNLKVLIAIGGWGQGSLRFSNMAKDPTKRTNFVTSVVNFVEKHGFDGLDMDWEYPGKRDGDPTVDKANFVELLKVRKRRPQLTGARRRHA